MIKRNRISIALMMFILGLGLVGCDSIALGNSGSKLTVVISSPPNGMIVDANTEMLVQVTGSDPAGVVRIDLGANGVLADSQSSPMPGGQPVFPVIMRWTPRIAGPYILQAVAYNREGAMSPPAMVSIQVRQVEPTPTRTIVITPTPTLTPTVTTVPTPTTTVTSVPTVTTTPTPTATVRPQGNCADPNSRWENVTEGQTLQPYAAFIGTATDENFAEYIVEWNRPAAVLHRSSTPVIHGVIFVWNTYTVPNGDFPVTLIVVLKDGTRLATCAVTIRVQR